jgi:hypothetical protein
MLVKEVVKTDADLQHDYEKRHLNSTSILYAETKAKDIQ